MSLFADRSKTSPALASRIKEWVRHRAGVGKEASITVAELACTEPGCPPVETVVAVFAPGRSPPQGKAPQAHGGDQRGRHPRNVRASGGPRPLRTRTALLGEERIELLGNAPRPGDALAGEFTIPAARFAEADLTSGHLQRGWVVLSTLPNIRRHACASQILDLEEGILLFPHPPRLYHVSGDEAVHWKEVDHFHPDLKAPGFTLHGASDASRLGFTRAFGVGVRGRHRIAHGLFALRDGEFFDVEIPDDQMQPPPVEAFLHRLAHTMGQTPRAPLERRP